MNVDFSPVIVPLLTLAGTAITILGGVAINALTNKLNAQNKAMVTAAWDDALAKSLAFGTVQAQALITEKGWDHIDVHNAVVAAAANYVVDRFPDALKGMGLSADMSDPANAEKIANSLKRALPAAFTAAANSPATPAAPNGPGAPVPVMVVNEPPAVPAA